MDKLVMLTPEADPDNYLKNADSSLGNRNETSKTLQLRDSAPQASPRIAENNEMIEVLDVDDYDGYSDEEKEYFVPLNF